MADTPSAELIRLFFDLWDASLAGREYAESNELPESLEQLPRTDSGDVQRALRYLNRIGLLVTKGPLGPDFVCSLVGKEVIRAVEKLRPLVEADRAKREDPGYLEYVDKLYDACRQAFPDYKAKYYPGERRSVGLTAQH